MIERKVYVNGETFRVISSDKDSNGERLIIQRLKGKKLYQARPYPSIYGADMARIERSLEE